MFDHTRSVKLFLYNWEKVIINHVQYLSKTLLKHWLSRSYYTVYNNSSWFMYLFIVYFIFVYVCTNHQGKFIVSVTFLAINPFLIHMVQFITVTKGTLPKVFDGNVAIQTLTMVTTASCGLSWCFCSTAERASCSVLLDFAMIPTVLPVKATSSLKHTCIITSLTQQ